MKLFLSLTLFFFICFNAYSQISFIRHYGPSGDGQKIILNDTGNYVVAGNKNSSGFINQYFLCELNIYGDTLWTKTYGGDSLDWGVDVIQTSDGGYALTGHTQYQWTNAINNIRLIRTDALGNEVWSKYYGGSGEEMAAGIIQLDNGDFIIGGSSKLNSQGGYDYLLIKINSSGDTLWTKTIGTALNEIMYSIGSTNDGGIIMAGSAGTQTSVDEDFFLVKADSTGDTLWTRNYGGTSRDIAYSIKQTNDNGFIASGTTNIPGFADYLHLIKTDSNGDTLWTATEGPDTVFTSGIDVIETSDGNFAVCGSTPRLVNTGGTNLLLMKFQSNGLFLWQKQYHVNPNSSGSNSAFGNSLIQTPDQGFAIAGAWKGDLLLVKTDADGIVGSEEFYTKENIRIFPNPSRGSFQVQFQNPGNKRVEFILMDVTGRPILKKETVQEIIVQETDATSGMYFYLLQGINFRTSGKLIIE